jgi:hypothetical protein
MMRGLSAALKFFPIALQGKTLIFCRRNPSSSSSASSENVSTSCEVVYNYDDFWRRISIGFLSPSPGNMTRADGV